MPYLISPTFGMSFYHDSVRKEQKKKGKKKILSFSVSLFRFNFHLSPYTHVSSCFLCTRTHTRTPHIHPHTCACSHKLTHIHTCIYSPIHPHQHVTCTCSHKHTHIHVLTDAGACFHTNQIYNCLHTQTHICSCLRSYVNIYAEILFPITLCPLSPSLSLLNTRI